MSTTAVPTENAARGPAAVEWFGGIAEDVARRAQAAGYKVLDFVTSPGDTVFVPRGWHHAVLNLTETVAVTQNFVSRSHLLGAIYAVREDEPHLSEAFEAALAGVATGSSQVLAADGPCVIDAKVLKVLRENRETTSKAKEEHVECSS